MGLGSGIRKKPIPDPGSRGRKGTISQIPDQDPQHWLAYVVMNFFSFKWTRKQTVTSRGVETLEDKMWPMFGTLVDERLFSLIAHESAAFHATHEPLRHGNTI
jgi:hypothetical protein